MSIAEKLVTVAENEQKVFDAGKQAEYDNFWDNFQSSGEPKSYQYAFAYSYLNDAIFKPKYNIVATDCSNMFNYNKALTNIKKSLQNRGVVLDTSRATSFLRMFYNCSSEEIPTIDLSSATNTERVFYSKDIITIEKVIFSENTIISESLFSSATELENIEIGGTICSDIIFSACTKLTHDSLMSIINHLKDFSGTTTTETCTLGTTNLAKLTNAEKKIATDKGWSLA